MTQDLTISRIISAIGVLLLCLPVVGACYSSPDSECASDDECTETQYCSRGGGVLIRDGVCLERPRLLDAGVDEDTGRDSGTQESERREQGVLGYLISEMDHHELSEACVETIDHLKALHETKVIRGVCKAGVLDDSSSLTECNDSYESCLIELSELDFRCEPKKWSEEERWECDATAGELIDCHEEIFEDGFSGIASHITCEDNFRIAGERDLEFEQLLELAQGNGPVCSSVIDNCPVFGDVL